MADQIPAVTSQFEADNETPFVISQDQDFTHCRGPLDGSPYAKVKKYKKSDHVEVDHVTDNYKVTTEHELPTYASCQGNQSTNHTPLKDNSTNQKAPNPHVVVVGGNKIIYKPDNDIDITIKTFISAPLATLPEFSSSYFSIASSRESVPSQVDATSHTVTTSNLINIEIDESSKTVSSPQYTDKGSDSDNMADRSIQQTAAQIVDDVMNKSIMAKRSDDVTRLRYSEISSCSATTLSSTTTEEGGGPHLELSDHDTTDSESLEDKLQALEGNISPGTVRGNISPELFVDEALSDAAENHLSPLDVNLTKIEVIELELPPRTDPIVDISIHQVTKEPSVLTRPQEGIKTTNILPPIRDDNMFNGGLRYYDKGPEYAVPMRDMKITTIPSKRAILVSTGSEGYTDHDNMAAQSSGERRDSVYDEGNSYNGAGYATIEEYDPQTNNADNLPEDVQELLNGLQEGPASTSDIDSGFHGSSMALQQNRGTNGHNHVTSQSSNDFSETFSPDSSQFHSTEASPTYDDGKIFLADKPGIHPEIHKTEPVVVTYCSQGSGPGNSGQPVTREVALSPMHKARQPGVTMSTQTLPEPQEAKIQIITMRNVYRQEQVGHLQMGPTNNNNNIDHRPPLPTKEARSPTTNPPQSFGNNRPVERKQIAIGTVPLAKGNITMGTVAMSPEAVTMRTPATMQTDDVSIDSYYDDIDEQDNESMKNVEEQIKHAQKHLVFLQEQQEKLKQRKEDRSKFKETLKRNSSAFEKHSQGFKYSPGVSSTLPRQPYSGSTENRRVESYHDAMNKQQPEVRNMPPITNANKNSMGGTTVQHNQPQNVWQPHESRPLTKQASDSSHIRNAPVQSPIVAKKVEQPAPTNDNDDILSSDLQEQLAELDRCIAQLTCSMDDPDDNSGQTQESHVVRRRKSFTLEIERKMDPNTPQEGSNSLFVPPPPARSRISFDSYKRLSQEIDVVIKGNQDINDDVFSPGPQSSRKKKQQIFPPQTSVTRRQHVAPAPPPKRRISLEERLSPQLLQALSMNPGSKPKENIHSYKEDLAPDYLPDTPTFPLSPPTPYVNNESPGRAKSPPGLQKTALSILHLQPTDKPTQSLHHAELPVKVQSPTDNTTKPTVEETPKEIAQNRPQKEGPVVPVNTVALQNGHIKETDLLNDKPDNRPVENNQHPPRVPEKMQQHSPVEQQGQVARPIERSDSTVRTKVISVKKDIQSPTSLTPPTNLPLPQPTNTPKEAHLHAIPPKQSPQEEESIEEILRQHHSRSHQQLNSGGSHSSHSPAATSSNSRHDSSDSLDGPSTRHSNSSLLSSSSSSSAAAHHGMPVPSPGAFMTPNNIMRPGSQLSSYERHMLTPGASGARSGDESFGSPNSGHTSSSSISDVERAGNDTPFVSVSAAPKFIRDTSTYWYKPDITRDQALAILRNKQPGSFVVRDSRCFPGAFGLALKVDKLPPNVQAKPGSDLANEYVRHFLIEPCSKGVKLKGCPNEPVFGSLSALVYQHTITPLALPCKLLIPTADQEIPQRGNTPRNSQAETPPTTPTPATTPSELLKQGAACNVIYIGSVNTESLTGPSAIERAILETYQSARTNLSQTSIVHFKVSPQGITLTDNARKLFFRRHYPTQTVTFCGLDPQGSANKGQNMRRWDASTLRGSPDAWLFGFVARAQAGSRDNTCHVFAELDSAQPARAIVNFVMKVLIGSNRQNSN
ncbi:uncharacterized protein LOC120329690 isoform X3 [Styela clava]